MLSEQTNYESRDNEMRKAFVTTGPQGSGKSTFCDRVVSAYPKLILVSRDDILMELFGTVLLSKYTGQHQFGEARMWKVAGEHLEPEGASIILDCWNGYPETRRALTRRLRSLGADQVEAWLFTTPKDVCVEWRLQKEFGTEQGNQGEKLAEHTKSHRKRAFLRDYDLFHSMPVSLSQGFDRIREIDPTEQIDFSSFFSCPAE